VIHVVVGHICSGKSTWVREQAGPDDVVIDFDRIALALATEGTRHHEYTQAIRDIVRVVRWFAIDEAVRAHRFGNPPNVWIIHAYPTDNDLARYRRLGAAIKETTAEPDTLVERAASERPASMQAELARRLAAGGWGRPETCHFVHSPACPLR
jgi:hypothetical protein